MDTTQDFYDHFIPYQKKSGINERIYSLYKRLDKLGINSHSNILEIGCGIGSLTYLLSRKVKHGKIEAVDLSPESINYAKQRLSKPYLQLTAGNILEYEPVNKSFDYILMFDVLEHIPTESHELLMMKISRWMHDNSTLLINIPNPDYILYDLKYNPEVLQKIDQPILIENIVPLMSKASLNILYFETYGIWVKNDYQFIIIKKKKVFNEIKLADERTLFEKTKVWIRRKWNRLFYQYP